MGATDPTTENLGAALRRAEARAAVAAALIPAGDLDTALGAAADLLVAGRDAAVGIWRCAEGGGPLALGATAGNDPALVAALARFPLDTGLLGRMVAERRPLADAASPAEGPADDRPPGFAGQPLLRGEDLLGVVALLARRPVGDEDVRMLADAAPLLAERLGRERPAEPAAPDGLLRAALDALPRPIWVRDAAGRLVFRNRAAGPLVDPLTGPPISSGDDRSALPAADWLASAEQRVVAWGDPLLDAPAPPGERPGTGDWRVSLAPVRAGDGEVAGVVGMAADASRQRQAEDALRRAERRYRDLFAEAPVMYTASRLTDRGPVLSDCNRMFWSTLGYASREEVIGRPLVEFFAPASREAVFAGGYAAALAGRLPVVERQLLARDGRVIDVLVQAGPDLDEQGTPRGTRAAFLDITERKRLEGDLRAAETRYRLLVERMPAVVYLLANDANHTPLYFSPRLPDLLGAPVARALARTGHWLDEVHPDDRARVAAESARAAAGGDTFRCEYRHRRADGSWLWVRDECEPQRDAAGAIVAWHGVMLDVADQHRLQDALVAARDAAEAAERRTHDVLARVTDGFLAVDRGWRLTYVNAAAERMLGRRGADVLGRLVREALPAAAGAALRTAFARATEAGEPVTVEFPDPARDAWFEVAAYPAPDGLSAFVRDVTERRRSAAERDRLAAIVASAEDAIVGKTLDGTVTSWNGGAERLYGWTAEEMVGRSLATIIPPDRREELAAVLDRLSRGEQVERFQTVRVARDGRRIAVSLTISPVRDGGGRVVGAAAIARDVTERERLEALRRDFLAMVTHDLRTPLTGVRGYAQLLLRRGEYREAAVAAILAEADRMQRLVDGLADVVRLEAGRLELRRTPVDLADLARQEVAAARVQAPDHLFAVEAPSAPVVGDWDADRLGQVLQNLLGNAARYAPAGSPVTVRIEADRDAARLVVRDEGPGIAPEHLPRLFERFYRAGATGAGGLGLGLYITRMIVEAHGGAIAVASDPGAGSAFTVTLPLTHPARE